MQGAPPPQLLRVTLANWLSSPFNRWSYLHARELVPTVIVSRGDCFVEPLESDPVDLGGVTFEDPAPGCSGQQMTIPEMLDATWTDGFMVMHHGKIVHEEYRNDLAPGTPHLLMSVSKSFTGTLAAVLAHEGMIDPNALVTHYLPELAASTYADASVRQVMDMTISVRFSEDYGDPHAEIWDFSRAMGLLPQGADNRGPSTQYEFLVSLEKETGPEGVFPHGEVFGYKTINTDVLAWIIRRVTHRKLAEVLADRFWSRLGCEQHGHYIVDSIGTEFAGGGFNAVLRDLGRFGQMMLEDGSFNNQQVVPKEVVDDIRKGGDRGAFHRSLYSGSRPGYSYRNQWWVTHNEHDAYSAIGVYGQRIYIDPTAKVVIVKVSSFPEASNVPMDQRHAASFHAISKYLSSHGS